MDNLRYLNEFHGTFSNWLPSETKIDLSNVQRASLHLVSAPGWAEKLLDVISEIGIDRLRNVLNEIEQMRK